MSEPDSDGLERSGSPYAPHTAGDTVAMLEAVGVDDEEALFDIPESVRYDGTFGIEARNEHAARRHVEEVLGANSDLVDFLGRGHYDHYVPAIVDHLALRSEFLTSYTQYQPEVAQGFLQVLFEYQSMMAELTGLSVVNCSIYDAATALGEAARLAARVRTTTGSTVLIPGHLAEGRRSTLENYVVGTDLTVEPYPMDDGNADLAWIEDRMDEDVLMVYAESPTVRGVIEEGLHTLGTVANETDAFFVVGSDPIALAVLDPPGAIGADVVIGDAASLGTPASYGMGMGLFATHDDHLRQVPGRLVGVGADDAGRRAYTLTLQTREQHIRRERATSNICTNQAWVGLRTAIHLASLGPDGLVDLATRGIRSAATVAARVDDITGVKAPVHDRHHFREFVARTDQPAAAVAADLETDGFAVHVIGDHLIQLCVTETVAERVDGLMAAFRRAAR